MALAMLPTQEVIIAFIVVSWHDNCCLRGPSCNRHKWDSGRLDRAVGFLCAGCCL